MEIPIFTSPVTIFLATQACICKTGSIILQDIVISAIFVVSHLSLGVPMAVFAVTWRDQKSSLDVISTIHDSLAAASVSYVYIYSRRQGKVHFESEHLPFLKAVATLTNKFFLVSHHVIYLASSQLNLPNLPAFAIHPTLSYCNETAFIEVHWITHKLNFIVTSQHDFYPQT